MRYFPSAFVRLLKFFPYRFWLIYSFTPWPSFPANTFPRCVLGRKNIYLCMHERMTFLNAFHMRSSVAPCCIFMISNISFNHLRIHGCSFKVHPQAGLFIIFTDLLTIKSIHTFKVNIKSLMIGF